MTSRAVAGGRALPPNPEFLEFERTDGDAKQWPTNNKEVVNGDGQVNYMKPLGPNDSSDIHWRCQVAMKAAERLGKPCTCHIHSWCLLQRTVLIDSSAGKNYVLKSWPEGYHMYCHYKGRQSSPRQDLYLIGPHPTVSSPVPTQLDMKPLRIHPHETFPLRSRVCASRNMAHDRSYTGPRKLRMQILCQGPATGHLREPWF